MFTGNSFEIIRSILTRQPVVYEQCPKASKRAQKMNRSRTDLSDVAQMSWTCPYVFNGLRGIIVKARLRRFVNGIKPASDDSRSVQGFIHQRVSTEQMGKSDVI